MGGINQPGPWWGLYLLESLTCDWISHAPAQRRNGLTAEIPGGCAGLCSGGGQRRWALLTLQIYYSAPKAPCTVGKSQQAVPPSEQPAGSTEIATGSVLLANSGSFLPSWGWDSEVQRESVTYPVIRQGEAGTAPGPVSCTRAKECETLQTSWPPFHLLCTAVGDVTRCRAGLSGSLGPSASFRSTGAAGTQHL